LLKAETWAFETCEELVARLKRRDWRNDFKKAHDEGSDFGPLSAVYRSVSSSTFRAFRTHKDWAPSVVFREWAARELAGGKFEELTKVRSKNQYRSWVVKLAGDLSREWHRRLRYDLEIPRSLKLVNLLAKGLCIVTPLWPENFEAIVWSVDVPLDKYSLRPLACVPELANLRINWRNASMGSVKNLKTYTKIQSSIGDFCQKAGVPPLAYDFLAWDVPHAIGQPGR
jgi:hypothetical protein